MIIIKTMTVTMTTTLTNNVTMATIISNDIILISDSYCVSLGVIRTRKRALTS